jgi:hypothetical protein
MLLLLGLIGGGFYLHHKNKLAQAGIPAAAVPSATSDLLIPPASWAKPGENVDPATDLPKPVDASKETSTTPATSTSNANPSTATVTFVPPKKNYFEEDSTATFEEWYQWHYGSAQPLSKMSMDERADYEQKFFREAQEALKYSER